MVYTRNPFTGKLDNKGSGSTAGLAAQPQSGVVSPEGTATSRYAGDQYLDTVTGLLYINPNASGTSGREIVQVTPS